MRLAIGAKALKRRSKDEHSSLSLYNSDDNKPAGRVLKQELVTYEQTEFGLKITKLERAFSGNDCADNYTSTPIVLTRPDK